MAASSLNPRRSDPVTLTAGLGAPCTAGDLELMAWEWTRSGSTDVLSTDRVLSLGANTLEAGLSYTFAATATYPARNPSPPLSAQVVIAVFRSTPIPAIRPPSQSYPSPNLPLDASATVDPDYPGDLSRLVFIW
ncbi:hypothetical protein BH23GEM7_BH23GEM7_29660 [soil metagenome]|nr:hypothetical protein [Gemmatimonadota bacterium]